MGYVPTRPPSQCYHRNGSWINESLIDRNELQWHPVERTRTTCSLGSGHEETKTSTLKITDFDKAVVDYLMAKMVEFEDANPREPKEPVFKLTPEEIEYMDSCGEKRDLIGRRVGVFEVKK